MTPCSSFESIQQAIHLQRDQGTPMQYPNLCKPEAIFEARDALHCHFLTNDVQQGIALLLLPPNGARPQHVQARMITTQGSSQAVYAGAGIASI